MRLCQWPLPFDLLVFAAFQSALGRRRITWRSLEELSDPKIVDFISVPKHSDQVISGFLPSSPPLSRPAADSTTEPGTWLEWYLLRLEAVQGEGGHRFPAALRGTSSAGARPD
jgi:hypothetical protein